MNSVQRIKGTLVGLCMLMVFAFVHFFINRPIWGISTNCDPLNAIKSNNDWQIIDAENIQASILWEKSIFAEDAVMTASAQSILFYQGLVGCEDDNRIIALDGNTGQQIWSYAAEIVRGILPVDDGYLVTTCCTSLVRLDNQGNQIWQSTGTPARIYRPNLFIAGDNIYLPTESTIHVFSLLDGSEKSPIEGRKALAAFQDFALLNTAGRTMGVENLETGEVEWTSLLPGENTLSNYDVFRFDDIVAVAWSLYQIDAYTIDSGEHLWEVEGDFLSPPTNVGDVIFTYNSDNQLILNNGTDGTEIGTITLSRNPLDQPTEPTNVTIGAVLAASEDKIFIWNNLTLDLIAISYQQDTLLD